MMNDDEIAKMFYDQKVAAEKMVSDPTGEFAALNDMFAEIQALGYDYHYLADIELRVIRDVRVMRILYRYYPKMEYLTTREAFIYKISPQKVPEVLEYAIQEYERLSDSDRMVHLGFQICISRAKKTPEYCGRMLAMLRVPDQFYSLGFVVAALCRKIPERMRPILDAYRGGLLFPCVICYYAYYDDEEAETFLKDCCRMTAEELRPLLSSEAYSLCPTYTRDCKGMCREELVHDYAKRALKKIAKRRCSH